ncbi:hypothetical protein A9179_16240 [Pseudomonas alcaligenes]|uniref:Peptidase inhibitor I78 family protein n=1 Tax=Aquipseudomonas alcaligenes TaxID=43263 RepID=A0ABR7S5D8_AQUAC|nr:I78 family peptidase inhibitor [Pseudomonas alcaligenes]MBC9251821.1 hypothetical protein [Pseudomonas alcaligenes]
MTRSLTLPTLLACAVLAACSSAPEQPQASHADGRCDAAPVQQLVGDKASAEVVENARQKAGAEYLRVTRPNQPVTMDYNPQRLNIDLNDAGVILRVNCG